MPGHRALELEIGERSVRYARPVGVFPGAHEFGFVTGASLANRSGARRDSFGQGGAANRVPARAARHSASELTRFAQLSSLLFSEI
jgi:hypothetical protein